jgi:dihydropteroate synthase
VTCTSFLFHPPPTRHASTPMSILHCGRHEIDLSSPCVMGIVNVTSDSFSADGRLDRVAALAHARRLLEEGAAIIDIGGESTRPGAAPVPEEVEQERVIPIVEALAAQGAVVSVDTMKPAVMRAAVAAGASMINDVKAFAAPGAIEAIAGSDVAVCLMHMQGEPRTMQQAPHYTDVATEVRAFLAGRARSCVDAGIASDRIIVDPGFGFGKSVAHNLDLLRCLDAIVGLGFPVLAGLSRKSTLGALTGRDVGGRVSASVAAALAAALRGARILRVHDVRETVDALAVWRAIEPWTGLQLRKGLE